MFLRWYLCDRLVLNSGLFPFFIIFGANSVAISYLVDCDSWFNFFKWLFIKAYGDFLSRRGLVTGFLVSSYSPASFPPTFIFFFTTFLL
jgi:hypothetical protein